MAVQCATCGSEYIAGTVLCADCMGTEFRPIPAAKPVREANAATALWLGIGALLLAVWPFLFWAGWGLGYLAIREGTRAQRDGNGSGVVAAIGQALGAVAFLIGFGSLLRLLGGT